MNEFVSDTMAVVLWLEKRRMPKRIKQLFAEAEANQALIQIPALVIAELAYLAEKKRIDITLEACMSYLSKNQNFRVCPMTSESIVAAFRIQDIKELHDRLIAAEGLVRKIRLITNDPIIQSSRHVNTLWE